MATANFTTKPPMLFDGSLDKCLFIYSIQQSCGKGRDVWEEFGGVAEGPADVAGLSGLFRNTARLELRTFRNTELWGRHGGIGLAAWF
jgi:hypothetical protein